MGRNDMEIHVMQKGIKWEIVCSQTGLTIDTIDWAILKESLHKQYVRMEPDLKERTSLVFLD
jgi:hypothetical protein